jgi:hypothetical protein
MGRIRRPALAHRERGKEAPRLWPTNGILDRRQGWCGGGGRMWPSGKFVQQAREEPANILAQWVCMCIVVNQYDYIVSNKFYLKTNENE